jgi:hypothetical protein
LGVGRVVGDVQLTGLSVELDPERVALPHRVDLGACPRVRRGCRPGRCSASASGVIRRTLPHRSFGVPRAPLSWKAVALRALVDRRVAVGLERVGVVAGGQVQVAVGVEDDVATHVAANPAVDRHVDDVLLAGHVERVPDEPEAREPDVALEAFPVSLRADEGPVAPRWRRAGGVVDWRVLRGRVVRRDLNRGGGYYIHAENLRNTNAEAAAALARPGRYRTVGGNLRVKEVQVAPGGDGDGDQGARTQRFVVCHNPEQATRDAAVRDRPVNHLQQLTAGTDTWSGRRRDELVGSLKTKPGLRRYLRRTKTGLLRIDHTVVKAEAHLDAKWLMRTSDGTLTAEDLAAAQKQLLQVERGSRDLKDALGLRPVFHHREDRIRGHVQLCWLALLLIRVVENATHDIWRTNPPRARPDAPGHPGMATGDGQITHRSATTPGRRPSWPPSTCPSRHGSSTHRPHQRLNPRPHGVAGRGVCNTTLPRRSRVPTGHTPFPALHAPIICGSLASGCH